MKQITEDYISYEIAKLLKEKGFDEPTMHFFSADGTKRKFQQSHYLEDIAQPTHQMALKWLREVYAICVEVCRNINTFYYSYRVIQGSSFVKLLDWSDAYDNYEQAVEAALLYVLKNLI